MKKIILGILLTSTLLGSCVREIVRDAYTARSVTPSISVVSAEGTPSFDIPPMVYDTTIMIHSNVWWSVMSADEAPWCSFSIDENPVGFTPVDFTLEPNTTGQDRVFSITLKAEEPVEYTQTFVMTQKFSSEKFAFSQEIERRTDHPVSGTVIMPKYEEALPFDITTNAAWRIVTTADWCTVVGADAGQPGVDLPVEVLCRANPTDDYRYATVSIVGADNVTLMEFDITQSNNFDAPTLTITNDDRKFGASWTSTDGARGYGVVIYDSLGVELTQITLGNNIFELNMTNFAAATGLTDYVGQIGISVKALTPQPDYFAESERILSNSHFADNGGNGMDASERFVISNERHLQNVSTAYPKGYFYYILGNSFDLSGKAMPSIGTVTSPFVGDFDGGSKNGLKVSNSAYERAEVDNTFLYYGMFGYVGNKGTRVSQIANFNFENCNLTINPAFNTANICWAIGVGSSNGATISNIKTTDCGILFNTKPNGNNNSNQSVGMIVGAQNGGRITGCVTEGGRIGREETILTGNHNNGISLGGIVGRTFGTVGPLPTLIEYCANISTVIRGHFAGGGIIGKAEGRTNVVDCYNMAPIFASGAVGGIVGGLTVSASELLVERCWNSGTLEYVRSNGPAKMGGIVGDGNYAVAITLSRCFNSGEIKFYNEGAAELNRVTNIGGLGGWLAGTAAPGRSRIYNCYNRGNVTVTIGGLSGPQTFAGTGNGGVGGIAGFMGGAGADVNARGNLQNSYNSGEVRVILEGATPGTVNALGNIFGRTNANQTQQPMYNAVYTGSIFAGDNPANAVIGAGNNVATFTTGFYRFTDLSSQAAFEALNDGGQSFDFSNIWEMKQGGYPILRGLYGNPAQ